MSIIGVHRGGAPHIGPENTLHAFRRSVECGARLLELDIRVTRDQRCVLMHDSAVGRTTDGEGNVRDMLLCEVQALDAAYWHPTLRGQGVRVPSLEEFLDEFAPDARLCFMLDFKDGDSIVAAFGVLQQRQIAPERLVLGSVFAAPNAMLLRMRAPEMLVASDTTESIQLTLAYSCGLLEYHRIRHDIFGYILRPETRWLWSQGLVRALQARGMRVMVFGVDLNEPAALRQCVEWGCDYVLTDCPDLIGELG